MAGREKRLEFCQDCLAHAYMQYGWLARGSGFVSTISAEGMSLFEERLRVAAKHLVEAQKADPDDPAIYENEIYVGKGLGIGKERLEKMLAAGVKADPNYHALYTAMGPCLLPRWYGEPDDIAKFLDKVLEDNPGDAGLAIYARVVGDLKCYESSTVLQLMGLDLEKVDKGTKVLLKQYPFSNKINSLACWCACSRRYRETARDIFGWLGDAADASVFGGVKTRDRLRHWAFDDLHPKNQQHRELVSLQSLTAVEYSPDGKTIAVAGVERLKQVTLWDAEKCELISVLPHVNGVSGIGFSPDGSKLVTAGGEDTEPQLMVWTLGEKPDLVELEGPLGKLRSACFSPDGKLIAAGGIDKTVWIWKTDDLEAKPTQIDVKDKINSLKFSPGSDLLAVGMEGSAAVLSLPTYEPMGEFKASPGLKFWDTTLNGKNLLIGGCHIL